MIFESKYDTKMIRKTTKNRRLRDMRLFFLQKRLDFYVIHVIIIT